MVHMLRSCRCRRGAKQLCTRVACVFFLALLGLQAAYAASYIGNVYSELDLNTHLQQAAGMLREWPSGVVTFTVVHSALVLSDH
jgi:hypothetical protein